LLSGKVHAIPTRATATAYANGHKDDWDRQLPLAVFAINNAASLGNDSPTGSRPSSSTAARILACR
jgi:hypothetical protein